MLISLWKEAARTFTDFEWRQCDVRHVGLQFVIHGGREEVLLGLDDGVIIGVKRQLDLLWRLDDGNFVVLGEDGDDVVSDQSVLLGDRLDFGAQDRASVYVDVDAAEWRHAGLGAERADGRAAESRVLRARLF